MINDYIGTPFEQLDCYALVREIYKTEHGINLLDPSLKYDDNVRIYHRFSYEVSKNWQRCQAKKGAVVAIRYNMQHPRFVTHFGYCINEFSFIHTTKETGAIVEKLSNIQNLIEGFYEYTN